MSYVKLKSLFREHSILNDINSLLSWDMATYMPKNSRNQRVEQIKILYEYKKNIFELIKRKNLFSKAYSKIKKVDDQLNLELMKKKYDYFHLIPFNLIKKKTVLSIECEGLWREARKKNNFNIVKKKLSDLVDVIKEESEILSQNKKKSRYDCLLEKYDRSLDTSYLNVIFKETEKFLKTCSKEIIFLNENNILKNKNDSLSEVEQTELSKIFMTKLGFNFNKGRIDKSLHPFCGGSSNDIRITTRYEVGNNFSCFDALMHETGHALYEQGLPKKWLHQPIGTAGGMSLHESQSLFIEMQIIKSLPASKLIERVIRKNFKKTSPLWEFKSIYEHRNKVKKGFIRVNSDEFHYPLHIIHRFNIEKKIFSDSEKATSLPDIWNDEFKKIFNLKVPDDNHGCLQDIHWFSGDFGYFPTYSVGAFIASQLKYKMKIDIKNIFELIEKGKFKPIINWLRKKIHENANSYKINDLLVKVTKEPLNINYFKKHIKERYIEKKF